MPTIQLTDGGQLERAEDGEIRRHDTRGRIVEIRKPGDIGYVLWAQRMVIVMSGHASA